MLRNGVPGVVEELLRFRPLAGIKVMYALLTKPVFMQVYEAVCGADSDFLDFIAFSVILIFTIVAIPHGCHSGADFPVFLKIRFYYTTSGFKRVRRFSFIQYPRKHHSPFCMQLS